MAARDILTIYAVVINLVSFIIMGWDKRAAIKDQFRISESTLFILAIIGGSIGSLLGMKIWHHKIRKIKFLIGMPLVLLLQIVLLFLITHNGLFKIVLI